ncbi:hypothetical protein BH09MYX1_BH09MYX1_31340 [soil metagenome]
MDDLHWGAEAVDPEERSLPGLKAAFLLHHVPKRGAVLELGSGNGKNLRTLAAHLPDLELEGCDIREPVRPPDGYRFTLIGGSLPETLCGRFDTVLVMDVLEHVPDPQQTIDDVAAALRPKGKLVAFIPVEGQPISAYRAYRRLFGDALYVETKEHIQAFSHDEVRQLLERRFRLDTVEYAYHALGQLMDATFFAAQRLNTLRRFWTSENQYYNAGKATAQGTVGAFNGLLRAANALAWTESRLLRRTNFTAAGQLVAATLR